MEPQQDDRQVDAFCAPGEGDVRQSKRVTVFTGPGQGVELEAAEYHVTIEGGLVIKDEKGATIVTWAAGSWRSIVNNEAFKLAFRGGNSDESPKRPRAVAASTS
jgi:hypothetical protein